MTSSVDVVVVVVVRVIVGVGVWEVVVSVLGFRFGLTLEKMMISREWSSGGRISSGVWVSVDAIIVGVIHSVVVVWVSVYRWCGIGGCILVSVYRWYGMGGCIWDVPFHGIFVSLGCKMLNLCSIY